MCNNKKPNLSDEEIKVVIALFLDKKSFSEIQKITGYSYFLVNKTLVWSGHWTHTKVRKVCENETREIIGLYKEGFHIKEIAEKLNRDPTTVLNILKKYNIDIRRTMPTQNTQKQIVNDYIVHKFSVVNINKKYGICFATLKTILKNHGFDTRRSKFYSINEDYFKKIDSHEKAYFVGLIMSDGCISFNRNKTKINKLSISLTEKDGYILDLFKESIQYTGIIEYYINPNKDGSDRKPAKRLVISNERFVSPLSKYGLYPVKSINHPFFKEVPEEFISSAILGYFDGDGSVSFSRNDGNRLAVSIISSIEFGETLLNTLKQNEIKCSMRIRITSGGFKMAEVRLKGNTQCLNLYKYMYKNNIKSLIRKKEIFENVIAQQKLGLIKIHAKQINQSKI